jgi:endo-1,4-beta-xylanase
MKTTAFLLVPLLAAATPLTPRASTAESLDVLYKGINKIYFGAATEYVRLQQGENQKIIHDRFGQVTPEWTMKWNATQPEKNKMTLGPADDLVNWATKNQKSIRGHTLLWHEEIPQYVKDINDYAGMKAAIEDHVTRLVSRWKGQIRTWDVVNEVSTDTTSESTTQITNYVSPDLRGWQIRCVP